VGIKIALPHPIAALWPFAEQFFGNTLQLIPCDLNRLGPWPCAAVIRLCIMHCGRGCRGSTVSPKMLAPTAFIGDGPSVSRVKCPSLEQGDPCAVWIWVALYGATTCCGISVCPMPLPAFPAPDALEDAVAIYRRGFQPIRPWKNPHFIAAGECIALPNDERGNLPAHIYQQAFASCAHASSGPSCRVRSGLMPKSGVQYVGSCLQAFGRPSAVGNPDNCERQLSEMIAEYQPTR